MSKNNTANTSNCWGQGREPIIDQSISSVESEAAAAAAAAAGLVSAVQTKIRLALVRICNNLVEFLHGFFEKLLFLHYLVYLQVEAKLS